MALIGYADLPVPAGGDGPDVPPALAALAAVLDAHLVQTVVDAADRDTSLAGAPARTVAVANDGTTWIRTASGWVTVWEPLPAWRPVSLTAGFSSGEYTPQIRRIGNRVYTRGRIIRTDGLYITAIDGVKLADVPADCRPATLAFWAGGASLSGDAQIGVGRVEVLGADAPSGGLGGVGSLTWWSQDGVSSGVAWVDISGSYWID